MSNGRGITDEMKDFYRKYDGCPNILEEALPFSVKEKCGRPGSNNCDCCFSFCPIRNMIVDQDYPFGEVDPRIEIFKSRASVCKFRAERPWPACIMGKGGRCNINECTIIDEIMPTDKVPTETSSCEECYVMW